MLKQNNGEEKLRYFVLITKNIDLYRLSLITNNKHHEKNV